MKSSNTAQSFSSSLQQWWSSLLMSYRDKGGLEVSVSFTIFPSENNLEAVARFAIRHGRSSTDVLTSKDV